MEVYQTLGINITTLKAFYIIDVQNKTENISIVQQIKTIYGYQGRLRLFVFFFERI